MKREPYSQTSMTDGEAIDVATLEKTVRFLNIADALLQKETVWTILFGGENR